MNMSQVGRCASKRVAQSGSKSAVCSQPVVARSQRCVSAAARYKIVEDAPTIVEPQAQVVTPEPAAVVAPEPAAVVSVPSTEDVPVPSADEVLESLTAVSSQATDAITSAAADVTGAASALASGAGEAVSDLTDALTGSVSGLTDALSGSVGGLGDALSGGVGGISGALTGGVGGLGDALSGGVDGISGALSGSVSGLGDAFSGSVGGLGSSVGAATEGASQAVQAASGAVGEALSGVTGAFSGATSALGSTVGESTRAATDAISSVTSSITSVTGSAVGSVASFVQEVDQAVGGTKAQVWGSLPPEAQDALVQVGVLVGGAAGLVAEYPLPALAVVGAVTIPAVINRYSSRFGGYAGELGAVEVFELLASEEPALLLDIRSDAVREKDGLPELKLGARFKAAALPVSVAQNQVALCDPRLIKNITSKEELVLAVHAAFVANLKQVGTPLVKVVVMDREGTTLARDIARALRREGLFSAFVMQDGYKGWLSNELPTTTQRGIDYDASTADLISDNIEVITEKTVALVSRLKDPAVAVPVVGSTALGAVALYYYETTLQVLGLAGITWSVYSELSKYDSPQEALSAWGSGIKKLTTPKPKPILVNGKPIPEGFVPPKQPAPPAAARAEEVLARAAAEAEAERKQAAEAAVKEAAAMRKMAEAASKATQAASKPVPAKVVADAPAEAKPAPVAAAAPAPVAAAAPAPVAAAAAAPNGVSAPPSAGVKEASKEDSVKQVVS